LIREIKQPSSEFGDVIMPCPTKVEETLAKKPCCTQGWHQGAVKFAEQGVVGPFNFFVNQAEQRCISEETWKQVEECKEVKSGCVDVTALNQVTPLRMS
jgi:hypothetical protein